MVHQKVDYNVDLIKRLSKSEMLCRGGGVAEQGKQTKLSGCYKTRACGIKTNYDLVSRLQGFAFEFVTGCEESVPLHQSCIHMRSVKLKVRRKWVNQRQTDLIDSSQLILFTSINHRVQCQTVSYFSPGNIKNEDLNIYCPMLDSNSHCRQHC